MSKEKGHEQKKIEGGKPNIPVKWKNPFSVLKKKWGEVPAAGSKRVISADLLKMNDDELVKFWEEQRESDTTGERFAVRGWYHTLYKDILNGKKVIDVGSGMGIDGITFAQNGAKITFVDIIISNLEVIKRLCEIYRLNDVEFCYMEDIESLSKLDDDYNAIWCQGSLINAPFEIMRQEVQELLKHLPIGGRWIELAYPKERWERQGSLPFSEWGKLTDGEATPWVEWYDLDKMMKRMEPAKFDIVLHFEFYDNSFNWFDLVRRS